MNEKAWVKFVRQSDNWGRFIAEPLERGFGTTLGNALRRVLLSSLDGAAVTSVKFEGVPHEFTTIPNVVEDVLDILFNVKELVVRSYSTEPKILKVSANSKGQLTAEDIEHDAEIEIINTDHVIANLSEKGKLSMELTVETGVGYRPADVSKNVERPIGTIPIDATFSPVGKVNFSVDEIRVGEQIGFDRLVLDVWTNGALGPDEAVKKAVNIIISQFNLFLDLNKKAAAKEAKKVVLEDDQQKQVLEMSIEDLELSARSFNCLKKANINSVKEILEISEKDLMNIKNFGRKSAEEIIEKLAQYQMFLKKEDSEEIPEKSAE